VRHLGLMPVDPLCPHGSHHSKSSVGACNPGRVKFAAPEL